MAALGAFLAQGQFANLQDLFIEAPRSIEVVDLDNDGDRDLLVGSRGGVLVLWNTDGTGTWSAPQLVATSEVVAHACDVDGDGLPDIVASREMNGGSYWFRNLGVFGFSSPFTVSSSGSAGTIGSGDLDQDGDRDLFLLLESGALQVLENLNGQGQFGPPQSLGALAGGDRAMLADVNADGTYDVVVSSSILGQTQVALASTPGAFTTLQPLSQDGSGEAVDLDGDGLPDLLLSDALAGHIGWKRQVNTGFLSVLTVDPGVQSERLEAPDVDGDGDRDLVAVLPMNHEIAWYENTDGMGTFGPRQTIAYGVADVVAFAAGDVDGDGDAELFFGSGALDRIVWAENLAVAQDRIVGRVFNDLDGNGLFDGNDHGLYHMAVHVPGIGTTFTNHSGVYELDALPGGHTVQLQTPPNWTVTGPSVQSALVAPPQNSAVGIDFPLTATGAVHHMEPQLTSSPPRCDQAVPYWLTVTNRGDQVGNARLTLALDGLCGLVTASPAPDAVINGVAEWNFQGLQPTHHRLVEVLVQMPDWQAMGDTLVDLATAEALVNGQVMSTHANVFHQVLECAYDPNDKLVLPEGVGGQHLTDMGSTLTYTIRFQNTGNAPAFDVLLVDQLDPGLDHASLRMLATSHPVHTLLRPDGELRFTFTDINLPDSASDPVGSQGFVRFAIDHLPGLAEGTEITNTASIFFDTNPAIVTNTVLNTLTYGIVGVGETHVAEGLRVHPNPVLDAAMVLLGEGFDGRTDLVLSDALGRTVRAWSISGDRAELFREGLPRGLYLLRAVGRTGNERVVRLVMD